MGSNPIARSKNNGSEKKMFLQDVIGEKEIIISLVGGTKDEVLEKLVGVLAQSNVLSDSGEFLQAVKERENLESTAIGGEIAIPHARHETVKKIYCAMGIMREPVEFNSLDGKPVKVVFMVAAPPDMNREYIQVIARAARLLKSDIMTSEIHKATTSGEIMNVIKDFDKMMRQTSVNVETKEGRVIHKDA